MSTEQIFEIYTAPDCTDTLNAELFLIDRNLNYVIKPLDTWIIDMVKQSTNASSITTPQIFKGEEYIGSIEDLIVYLIFGNTLNDDTSKFDESQSVPV